MKLAVITHVSHGQLDGTYYAYGPYVREMNIWMQYADSAIITAPMELTQKAAIDLSYKHNDISFLRVRSFDLKSAAAIGRTIIVLPMIVVAVFRAMRSADHIHLRCPGNMGLIGCFVQIFFPNKKKTAKYAGNWDPNASQPLTYRLQRYILSNTFLTKNMNVLTYGTWPDQSDNVKSFFTATYRNADKVVVLPRSLETTIRFVFVGSLSAGKRPLYAVQLVEQLAKSHPGITLDLFGEGPERNAIEAYIKTNKLESIVCLHGNKEKKALEVAYQNSHFVILASKSEGWPKAVAEAMFWGCVPLVSNVSCVAEMVGHGSRGMMLNIDLDTDAVSINSLIADETRYRAMSEQALQWSQQYTIEKFDLEIQKLIKC